jgi:hypothetical protein
VLLERNNHHVIVIFRSRRDVECNVFTTNNYQQINFQQFVKTVIAGHSMPAIFFIISAVVKKSAILSGRTEELIIFND